MYRPWLGVTSLVLLNLVSLWLVLLIWDATLHPPVETLVQARDIGQRLDWLFRLSYLNAVLFTLVTTAWLAGLGLYCWERTPVWSAVALVFVPVYCTLNLVAYGSQITVVPALVELADGAQKSAAAGLLLSWMVHLWPDSIVATINALAYGVLGIPSIIFGTALARTAGTIRAGGALLAFSGAASIVGFIGPLLDGSLLSGGTVLGGALFWLALFPLTWSFLTK